MMLNWNGSEIWAYPYLMSNRILGHIHTITKVWWQKKGKYYRYTFSSNHYVHQSLCSLCFGAPDLLTDRFYKNLLIKGSGTQKQRSYELLSMLWYDGKVYLIFFVADSSEARKC